MLGPSSPVTPLPTKLSPPCPQGPVSPCAQVSRSSAGTGGLAGDPSAPFRADGHGSQGTQWGAWLIWQWEKQWRGRGENFWRSDLFPAAGAVGAAGRAPLPDVAPQLRPRSGRVAAEPLPSELMLSHRGPLGTTRGGPAGGGRRSGAAGRLRENRLWGEGLWGKRGRAVWKRDMWDKGRRSGQGGMCGEGAVRGG